MLDRQTAPDSQSTNTSDKIGNISITELTLSSETVSQKPLLLGCTG